MVAADSGVADLGGTDVPIIRTDDRIRFDAHTTHTMSQCTGCRHRKVHHWAWTVPRTHRF